MNFLIISHVEHKPNGATYAAYAPYVREMNLWLKYVDSVTIVAPKVEEAPTAIDIDYKHDAITLKAIPSIQLTSVKHILRTVFKLPILLWTIFKACRKADHIHLRCPGNIGLLGCFVQILFPKKIKTAKYAGNWNPKAIQPTSYKLQKWLLSNTNLTKNMQVLVYGDWKDQTKNIKSFFTATFTNKEIEVPIERDYNSELHFTFVGSLVIGKRPLLTIQIIERLITKGIKARLDMYGDGILREELQEYISKNNLEGSITLHGNQNKEVVKSTLKQAHFLILPSKSEGWPKAVAEAMFFGAIPIVTKISCVPYMLDYGNRGVLIAPKLEEAITTITAALDAKDTLNVKSSKAIAWSQNYTLDLFESEIKNLVNKN
jgi:glycosyltransferase involved in cell wall biosynthesis